LERGHLVARYEVIVGAGEDQDVRLDSVCDRSEPIGSEGVYDIEGSLYAEHPFPVRLRPSRAGRTVQARQELQNAVMVVGVKGESEFGHVSRRSCVAVVENIVSYNAIYAPIEGPSSRRQIPAQALAEQYDLVRLWMVCQKGVQHSAVRLYLQALFLNVEVQSGDVDYLVDRALEFSAPKIEHS
jgi:head-tail adaptor